MAALENRSLCRFIYLTCQQGKTYPYNLAIVWGQYFGHVPLAGWFGSCAGRPQVPSLFRFLIICGVLVGIAYAAMFALTLYVEPHQREMSVKVPSKIIGQ